MKITTQENDAQENDLFSIGNIWSYQTIYFSWIEAVHEQKREHDQIVYRVVFQIASK